MQGVLLTGATGLVGQALLPRLLAVDPAITVFCLIRAGDDATLDRRRTQLLADAAIAPADHDRVIAVAGDIESPGLGITDPVALAGQVDTILSTAASTRFDLALESARRINVGSVERLVEFARLAQQHGDFDRMHHVSTAYVAGDHSGVIDSPPVEPLGAFRNTYEQSKWEAEQVLRGAGDVPFTISRPSIIVGDSVTGATPHFKVLYEPMKWVFFNSHSEGDSYSSRLTDVLPCRPHVRLDVVPVDFVADAIVGLLTSSDALGHTFHITAGVERALSIEETVDVMLVAVNDNLAASGSPLLTRPRIVSPEMIEADDELREVFELAESVMSLYLPYGLTEQVFSADSTHATLGHASPACPHPQDYYPALARYATATNFGMPAPRARRQSRRA